MSLAPAAADSDDRVANLGVIFLILALVRRPRLWLIAIVTARRLVRSRWWSVAPFLPLPDWRWIGFRLETAYGSTDASISEEDLVGYLEWCQMMRKIA